MSAHVHGAPSRPAASASQGCPVWATRLRRLAGYLLAAADLVHGVALWRLTIETTCVDCGGVIEAEDDDCACTSPEGL